MKDKIAKLIDVKTIITFAIVFSTIGLAAAGKISADKIADLALMVVSFYFGVKATEKHLLK